MEGQMLEFNCSFLCTLKNGLNTCYLFEIFVQLLQHAMLSQSIEWIVCFFFMCYLRAWMICMNELMEYEWIIAMNLMNCVWYFDIVNWKNCDYAWVSCIYSCKSYVYVILQYMVYIILYLCISAMLQTKELYE